MKTDGVFCGLHFFKLEMVLIHKYYTVSLYHLLFVYLLLTRINLFMRMSFQKRCCHCHCLAHFYIEAKIFQYSHWWLIQARHSSDWLATWFTSLKYPILHTFGINNFFTFFFFFFLEKRVVATSTKILCPPLVWTLNTRTEIIDNQKKCVNISFRHLDSI